MNVSSFAKLHSCIRPRVTPLKSRTWTERPKTLLKIKKGDWKFYFPFKHLYQVFLMAHLRKDSHDKEIIIILSHFLNIISDTVAIVCFSAFPSEL